MQANDAREERAAAFEILLELGLDIGEFAGDWAHCDRLATYVARMVSHNRADSLQYANLFSSAFNELLETAYRNHRNTGQLGCAVLRDGPVDRIELSIPCDDKLRAFYVDAIVTLQRDDCIEFYVRALLDDGPLDPRIGLLELAVDYNARLSLQTDSADSVRLIAELKLDTPVATVQD